MTPKAVLDMAQEIIDVAKRRGFKVLIDPGPPPNPYLNGNPAEATPILMDCLKEWRLEIIELLQKEADACKPINGQKPEQEKSR